MPRAHGRTQLEQSYFGTVPAYVSQVYTKRPRPQNLQDLLMSPRMWNEHFISLGGWKHDTVIAPHHVEDRVQDFLACFLDISYIFWRCRRCTVWRGVATIFLGPKVCGVCVLPAVDGSARALSPDASEWLMETSCTRPDLMKAQFMTWLAVWWEAHEIAWIMLGSYVRTLLYKQESRGSLMLCWHTGAGHCPFQEDPNWE